MNGRLQLFDLHFFQEMLTLSSSDSKKTQTLSVIDHGALLTTLRLVDDAVRARGPCVCTRDSDRELLKNSLLFERRYLSNGKSDRDETASVR